MSELRRIALCLPMIFALPLSGGCDSDDEAGTGEEHNDESGTTEHESGAEHGDGDGDGAEHGDGDGAEHGDGDGDEPDTEGVSCEIFDTATPQDVTAATSAGEAATAPIVPSDGVVYEITLPEGAAGFVELQIADWDTTQAFYTNADIDYTITTDAQGQVPDPRVPLSDCPDASITSQDVFFPHWTPATLEFSATGPRQIQLVVIQTL